MNKQATRRALGRGLSNLIPTQPTNTTSDEEAVVMVDVNSIKTNPFQPRTDFDDEEIKGLADSIKNQGLLQPIVLRKKENSYEIISGERRFRAMSKVLGRDKVPCIIKEKVTDREMLELALVENIQREQLNEIEKAIAYQKLLLECNYTHEELSQQVGKSRASITNTLRLLNLPEAIQSMVRKNEISMGHARAILGIDNSDKQLELAKRVVEGNLSVRDIERESQEEKATRPKKTKPDHPAPQKLDPDLAQVLERLQYRFGTSVQIKQSSEDKGKIEIEYYNEKDLTRITDLLLGITVAS